MDNVRQSTEVLWQELKFMGYDIEISRREV